MSSSEIQSLDAAFRNFVLHLRGEVGGIETELDVVESRVTHIENSVVSNEALENHIAAETPHPAYDRDIPDLTIIFNNVVN